MKIIHIGIDSQFTQFAAAVFESVVPGANEYVIVSDARELSHPIAAGTVRVVPTSLVGVRAIRSMDFDCDLLVAHAMTSHAAMAFSRAPRRARTMWSGWGYDYYGSAAGSYDDLYGPETGALVRSITAARAPKRQSLPRRLASGAWQRYSRRLISRAGARADYFSAPVPTDEPVFRSRFPRFRGSYAQLNYASDEGTFAAGVRNSNGRGILVGNSASPFNNHLEAFDLLAKIDLAGRRVLVPLSYGDAPYRDAIVARGSELFGAAFVPLIDRMPLDEYNALVSGCDVVVMNQLRQQAVGNIGTALHAGATLVFDPANPLYEFLVQSGAVVRSRDEVSSAGALGEPLEPREVASNRRMLTDFWGEQRVRDNVAALVAGVGTPR